MNTNERNTDARSQVKTEGAQGLNNPQGVKPSTFTRPSRIRSASLRSLGRAPRQNPHDRAYYEGAARALDIMAWSKEHPEGAGTARDLAMTHTVGFVEYFWRTPWRGYNG